MICHVTYIVIIPCGAAKMITLTCNFDTIAMCKTDYGGGGGGGGGGG